MQEVFEKIIEKLEQQAEQYHARANEYAIKGIDRQCEHMAGKACSYEHAIEIVKQEAAEYSNGWIPVSSGRLPNEREDVEVTVEEIADEVGGKRYYNVRSWLQDGQWIIKKNPYHPAVIAWRYPTEPYQQPKGE